MGQDFGGLSLSGKEDATKAVTLSFEACRILYNFVVLLDCWAFQGGEHAAPFPSRADFSLSFQYSCFASQVPFFPLASLVLAFCLFWGNPARCLASLIELRISLCESFGCGVDHGFLLGPGREDRTLASVSFAKVWWRSLIESRVSWGSHGRVRKRVCWRIWWI